MFEEQETVLISGEDFWASANKKDINLIIDFADWLGISDLSGMNIPDKKNESISADMLVIKNIFNASLDRVNWPDYANIGLQHSAEELSNIVCGGVVKCYPQISVKQ